MKGIAVLISLALMVATVTAQDRPQKKEIKQTPNMAAPVTEAEANQVLARLEKAIYKIVGKKTAVQPRGGSSKPANRETVIAAFNTLFEAAKPKFKFTPRMVKYNASMLKIPKAHPLRDEVEKLISWGCVAKVGPLVTSEKATFTPSQMGDAVGLFMARIADLTHSPSSRFSPYMSGNNPESANDNAPGKTGGG